MKIKLKITSNTHMPTFMMLGSRMFPLHRRMLEYRAEAMENGKKKATVQK